MSSKWLSLGYLRNTYAKSYFRQQQTAGVKLPIKWMAYESLTDGIFSEKTDVVSYLITSRGVRFICRPQFAWLSN